MANYIGAKLSRLIQQRAYSAGEIERLIELEVELPAIISKARKDMRAAKQALLVLHERVGCLDEQIQQLSAMDPADIRSIRTLSRKTVGDYGGFRRELIQLLKEFGGALTMSEMVDHMANLFSMPMVTPQDKVRATYLVRRPLNHFRKKGAIERLPSFPGKNEGVWRWIAGQDVSDA